MGPDVRFRRQIIKAAIINIFMELKLIMFKELEENSKKKKDWNLEWRNKNYKKKEPNVNSRIEIKSSLEGSSSRLFMAGEIISKLEDRSIEISTLQNREKKN